MKHCFYALLIGNNYVMPTYWLKSAFYRRISTHMIGGSPIPVERFTVASEMTETVGHFVILRPAEAIIGA